MGMWDYISGSAESIKRNSADLTPVKTWCCSSYGSVKDNGGKLVGRFWPSQETRSKIGPFALSLAKHSAEEGIKFIPGGFSTYKVIKKSVSDVNKSESVDQVDVKALNARVSMLEAEVSKYKKIIDRPIETSNAAKTLESDSNPPVAISQKPEDVIRVFMMKEFIGTQFLIDLHVPGTSQNKKK